MKYKKYILATLICAVLAVVVYADSGYTTENDPLVTLSYVEKIKGQILNELLKEIDIESITATKDLNIEYEVVEVKIGQKVMADSSCELIFRSGKAKVVVTSDANKENSIGLSDITGGSELLNGDSVPVNHYILIPRADGRGIEITSDAAYLMIRGEYKIVTE